MGEDVPVWALALSNDVAAISARLGRIEGGIVVVGFLVPFIVTVGVAIFGR